MKTKECTCITNGTVIKLNHQGLDFPTRITVEYEVDNKKYQITEGLAMNLRTIKIGFLPIGQKKTPKINSKVGSIVEVCYNPNNPSNAYIVGNKGVS